MQNHPGVWASPIAHLTRTRPDAPVLYFAPGALQATADMFQDSFPGLVTYAVKANPHPAVLDNLVAAGLTTFDVASPAEMQAARVACPRAVLHYNNPVRSRAEVDAGIALEVASWSIDDASELDKLRDVPRNCEVAVRFNLKVSGAAYDFSSKFGVSPEEAAPLLHRVAAEGFTPALTFHPGTQCENANAWTRYIEAAARIAETAGVRLARLNVGGGFPVARRSYTLSLAPIFRAITDTARAVFGADGPTLVCEPGRAMVGDAFILAARVKAIRADGTVYLNDGIYGGLTDLRDTGLTTRIRTITEDGTSRTGACQPRIVFGPTCDSLDRLPDGIQLPDDLREADYLLFEGIGAYSLALNTTFNGYGLKDVVTTLRLTGQ